MAPRRALLSKALSLAVVAASLAVLLLYATRALALVRYPWDWSPDEGLTLDHARRLVEAPERLYARDAVPFPLVYGPLLSLLLSPVAALCAEPFAPARVVAMAWTALGTGAVYRLVRQRADRLLALASAALYLAPMELSFWHMLLRVDGLMTALWLAAAVPLLPRRPEGGSDRLSPPRIAAGAALMLAAVLTKPTAAIHGAPVVLAWLFVDGGSARRLWSTLGAAGLVLLGALHWSTSGAFLWSSRIFRAQPAVPGQLKVLATWVLFDAWPLLALLLWAGVWSFRSGQRPGREPSLLLLLGGMLMAPGMAKSGASWNYLLPAVAATIVVSGRLLGDLAAKRPGSRAPTLAPLATAGLALLLATTRAFPLPSAEDERTAAAFYSFVRSHIATTGGAILVSRPDYAYFVGHQPVEIEGSSFRDLFEHKVAGTERVLERARTGAYSLIVWTWPLPSEFDQAAAAYRRVGGCTLAWYFGRMNAYVFVRRDVATAFAPPPSTRCRPLGPLPPAGTGPRASP